MTESTILCDNLKHCCLKTLPSSIFNPAKRPVCPSVSRLLTQTNLCEASEFVKLELEKKSFHLPVGNRVLLLCRANSIQRCHSPLRNSVCLSLNYHDWTIWRKYGWQYLAIFGNLLQYLAIFCNILQYLVIFGNIIKENLVGHILAGRKHSFFPEILFFKANFFCPVPLCLSCDVCADEMEAAVKGCEAATGAILYNNLYFLLFPNATPVGNTSLQRPYYTTPILYNRRL